MHETAILLQKSIGGIKGARRAQGRAEVRKGGQEGRQGGQEGRRALLFWPSWNTASCMYMYEPSCRYGPSCPWAELSIGQVVQEAFLCNPSTMPLYICWTFVIVQCTCFVSSLSCICLVNRGTGTRPRRSFWRAMIGSWRRSQPPGCGDAAGQASPPAWSGDSWTNPVMAGMGNNIPISTRHRHCPYDLSSTELP